MNRSPESAEQGPGIDALRALVDGSQQAIAIVEDAAVVYANAAMSRLPATASTSCALWSARPSKRSCTSRTASG